MFFAFLYVLILLDVRKVNINEINAGVLAYLGDAVYEQKIRNYLVNNHFGKASYLQKEAIKYVSAKSQANILEILLEKQILTEEELYTIGRARNYKTNSKPKNTDIKTYKKATALEALFGMLYLEKNYDRIDDIIKEIVGE